jgi:two-component sensor histidine kinase
VASVHSPFSGEGVDPGQQAPRRDPRPLKNCIDNVRVRLALLVLIAAIPLLILSGTIALQNYRMALDVSAQTAARLRESAIARHEAAVSGAEQMMIALSHTAGLLGTDAAVCQQSLKGVLDLYRDRYSNLAVLGPDGGARCSATPLTRSVGRDASTARNVTLVAEASAAGTFTLGAVRISLLTGAPVIPALMPLYDNGKLVAFLYAGLRIGWFASMGNGVVANMPALWIADDKGLVTQVASTGQSGLPQPELLHSLLDRSGIVEAASVGGNPYAYASAPLGHGYRLLVAYPAKADQAAARSLLIRRVMQLAALLLLGLTAVAIGTHVALVEPLDRLGEAVRRWRVGGTFDASSLDSAPAELRELARSFAEATDAIAEHAARSVAAVEQQELAMKEIHHRVKNNLQIVASLLNLQASRIRQPEAKAEFASARDRVRALATLHRHLYAQGEVHTINMRSFLTELCGQLFAAMGEREGARIALNIEASELQMSSDQAVPMALIVTEAVSNALKYAFPKGRTGSVDVSLRRDGDEAELTISDNGIGIPAGRADTDMGVRDGIGLTLIRGFARQLGGTLTVHEDEGTCYSLLMPLKREAEIAEV